MSTGVYGQHVEGEKRLDATARVAIQNETSPYLSKRIRAEGAKKVASPVRNRNAAGKKNGMMVQAEPEVDALNEVIVEMRDGSETAYVFSEDVKFTDENGVVRYKDTSIILQTDDELSAAGYRYTNGANDYRIHFSTDPTKGVFINENQNMLTFAPIPQGEGKISGATAAVTVEEERTDVFEYPNVFGKHTNLRYTPQLNSVRKDIILDKYTGQNKFDFLLSTHGNEAELVDGKIINIINPATGDTVNSLQPVFAYDSFSGEYSDDGHFTDNCSYELSKISASQYNVTIVVDEAFLKSENTKYPVTIDPVTSSINNSLDTPIYSGYDMVNKL